MKKYLKRIKRRLNLPKEIRQQVMDGLSASITARREAGQTDARIMAELGEPKKVAGKLNEQMMAYAYRKSPWRFLFLAGAVLSGGWLMLYGSMLLLFDLLPAAFSPGEAASIGIIGGADGPTAIFIAGTATRGFDWDVLIPAAILAVSIPGFLLLRKCRQK